MGVPTPRTGLAAQRSTAERLDILESRGGIPARLTGAGRGSAAERDIYFTVPTTAAERVALANRSPVWFNTDTGREEGYYATTGQLGLTVRGLVAGVPDGWYPQPGSLLTGTRIQGNGFQAIPGGGAATPSMASGLLVNIGGFAATGLNGLVLPIPGYYSAAGAVYYSGGGVMAYVACLLQESVGGSWRDLIASRVPGQAADVQPAVSATGILFPTATTITLLAMAGGAQNIFGDGVTRRTFLTATYEGPALVNG